MGCAFQRPGGLLWFRDLTVPDETLAVPLVSLALSYFSLDVTHPSHAPLHQPDLCPTDSTCYDYNLLQRFRHTAQQSEGAPPRLLPSIPRLNAAKVATFMQTSLIALAPLICAFPSVRTCIPRRATAWTVAWTQCHRIETRTGSNVQQGFFMFLIPSSIFNIYQSAMLTSENFRARVGLDSESLIGQPFFGPPRLPDANSHLHTPPPEK